MNTSAASLEMLLKSGPWPELIMCSFFAAKAVDTAPRGRFHGAWNHLLHTFFPPATMFGVAPEIPPTPDGEAPDYVSLVVYFNAPIYNRTPVFVVEMQPPSDINSASKRQETDEQFRRRLGNFADRLAIPVLHGICVFGTNMAFYSIDRETKHLQSAPPKSANPDVSTEPASLEWWSLDIMEEEGANRFRATVDEVKEMCSHGPVEGAVLSAAARAMLSLS